MQRIYHIGFEREESWMLVRTYVNIFIVWYLQKPYSARFIGKRQSIFWSKNTISLPLLYSFVALNSPFLALFDPFLTSYNAKHVFSL